MKLKVDEKGNVVVVDGKPVYIHTDGKEVAFDAPGTIATISRLNSEAKGHRERAEKAEGSLKLFEGMDADLARKAVETVKNFDAKKLIDAGDADKVRADAVKSVEERFKPIVTERDSLRAALHSEKIGGSFSRSKLIAEKLAIPADLVQARFGNAFRIEGDQVIAVDQAGNKLFSRENPGAPAGFDEALSLLIEQYPYRDQILKSSGASGGGAQGGGSGQGGNKTIPRATFEAMPPAQQMITIKSGVVPTD